MNVENPNLPIPIRYWDNRFRKGWCTHKKSDFGIFQWSNLLILLMAISSTLTFYEIVKV